MQYELIESSGAQTLNDPNSVPGDMFRKWKLHDAVNEFIVELHQKNSDTQADTYTFDKKLIIDVVGSTFDSLFGNEMVLKHRGIDCETIVADYSDPNKKYVLSIDLGQSDFRLNNLYAALLGTKFNFPEDFLEELRSLIYLRPISAEEIEFDEFVGAMLADGKYQELVDSVYNKLSSLDDAHISKDNIYTSDLLIKIVEKIWKISAPEAQNVAYKALCDIDSESDFFLLSQNMRFYIANDKLKSNALNAEEKLHWQTEVIQLLLYLATVQNGQNMLHSDILRPDALYADILKKILEDDMHAHIESLLDFKFDAEDDKAENISYPLVKSCLMLSNKLKSTEKELADMKSKLKQLESQMLQNEFNSLTLMYQAYGNENANANEHKPDPKQQLNTI